MLLEKKDNGSEECKSAVIVFYRGCTGLPLMASGKKSFESFEARDLILCSWFKL